MITEYLEELSKVHKEISLQMESIKESVRVVKSSNLVLTMGNGGSASTAQHFAQGLCDVGIRAICLTDNISLLTAISNDESYAESLKSLVRLFSGDKGTVVVVISASGSSSNIIMAVNEANRLKLGAIGLVGFGGGKAASIVTLPIILNSRDYGVIEDSHLSICHIICKLIEEEV